MLRRSGPWGLPSADVFLEEVMVHQRGVAVVCPGDEPDGLDEALCERLGHDAVIVDPGTHSPLTALADAFGCAATLAGLLQQRYRHFVVDLRGHPGSEIPAWQSLWRRLEQGASTHGDGAPTGWFLVRQKTALEPTIVWPGWRRIDTTIWSELESGRPLTEPWDGLRRALAVEVGAGNLDLVGEIASAGPSRLSDLLGLLRGCSELESPGMRRLDGIDMTCSLTLVREEDWAGLSRRVWRAHLIGLFWWIEETRQRIIERYGRHLRPDQVAWDTEPRQIEDLEFTSLVRQLSGRLSPPDLQRLRAFRSMRNALAHGQGVSMDDLQQAIDFRNRWTA